MTAENFADNVVHCELTGASLQNLSLVSQEVVYPMLSNPANRETWSGPASKQVLAQMNGYLSSLFVTVGQAKGKTLLPLPAPDAFDTSLPEKERVYALESAVKRWIDQVEVVLKVDSESLLRTPVGSTPSHPGPLVEIAFWKHVCEDRLSVLQQLESPEMRRVAAALVDLKSPSGALMERTIQMVRSACDEAGQNARFLRALLPLIQQLEDELDFARIEELFVPIMHTLLLIFTHSTTYNSRTRLVTFMQMLCNSVVAGALKNINGETIFRRIEDENVTEAMRLIKVTIHVCDRLKEIFNQYKEKAISTLQTRAWDTPRETLFARLDAFLERCQDVLEVILIRACKCSDQSVH